MIKDVVEIEELRCKYEDGEEEEERQMIARGKALEAIRNDGYNGAIIEAKWGEASDRLAVSWEPGGELENTMFQVADAEHDYWEAAKLLEIEEDGIGIINTYRDNDESQWVTIGKVLDADGKETYLYNSQEEEDGW
ncbi:MAG TPA: hypothetical protein VJW95_04160 [Dissulfurispiraceae bacterium]|nr:hypothetical protein [Dissulfurispiraceae bacterium]